MLALAVAKDVECVMKKHVYKFAGEVYNQNEGGAIGNELTGVVAKTRMIYNVRKLKNRLNELRNRWFVEKETTLRSGKKVIKYNVQVKDLSTVCH